MRFSCAGVMVVGVLTVYTSLWRRVTKVFAEVTTLFQYIVPERIFIIVIPGQGISVEEHTAVNDELGLAYIKMPVSE
jgi:hypothetical protein